MPILSFAVLIGVGALATWIVIFNVRGRRRERQLREQRGVQTATDFASLFDTPTDRFIAVKLFPYLQMGTMTRQFSFRKDDRLRESPLRFVADDVTDNLRSGFWDEIDLGMTGEELQTDQGSFANVNTIGELVQAISAVYAERYGPIRESP